MKRKMVTFGRVMNGYEFIEFMRKFGWKHNGQYYKPHNDLAFNAAGYCRLSETRRKFEGWDFWFGRLYPMECLDEETEITYTMLEKPGKYIYECVKEVLLRNGFTIKGE